MIRVCLLATDSIMAARPTSNKPSKMVKRIYKRAIGINISGNGNRPLWYPQRLLYALRLTEERPVKLSNKRRQCWRWFNSLQFQNTEKAEAKQCTWWTSFSFALLFCVFRASNDKNESCRYQDIQSVRARTTQMFKRISRKAYVIARSPGIFWKGLLLLLKHYNTAIKTEHPPISQWAFTPQYYNIRKMHKVCIFTYHWLEYAHLRLTWFSTNLEWALARDFAVGDKDSPAHFVALGNIKRQSINSTANKCQQVWLSTHLLSWAVGCSLLESTRF